MAKTFVLVLSTLFLLNVVEGRRKNVAANDQTPRDRRDAAVDLHGEFCVDVSTYDREISFNRTTKEKCDTRFEKNCRDKEERVCGEVTDIQCEIVPYTECLMTMNQVSFRTFKEFNNTFPKKVCNTTYEYKPHQKMVPECKNITRQNCVTKWETDDYGKQVWAGNEDCEPVTWRDCKLVPHLVNFKVPLVNCYDGETVTYPDWEEWTDTKMTNSMKCKVRYTANCKPFTSNKCQVIRYQECDEEPIVDCKYKEKQIPWQKLIHKKKCLLPDNVSIEGPVPDYQKRVPDYGPQLPEYAQPPTDNYAQPPTDNYAQPPADNYAQPPPDYTQPAPYYGQQPPNQDYSVAASARHGRNTGKTPAAAAKKPGNQNQ